MMMTMKMMQAYPVALGQI